MEIFPGEAIPEEVIPEEIIPQVVGQCLLPHLQWGTSSRGTTFCRKAPHRITSYRIIGYLEGRQAIGAPHYCFCIGWVDVKV
jgi:hypothetical protein